MKGQGYVVSLGGWIWADTTVAVVAKSEEDAKRKALAGAYYDSREWFQNYDFREDPWVTDVSEETPGELEYADQKHLLKPRDEDPGGHE